VPAWHGSGVAKDETAAGLRGESSGLVISIRGGPTLMKQRDTRFFSDMARVADYNTIDIMLVASATIHDGTDTGGRAVKL